MANDSGSSARKVFPVILRLCLLVCLLLGLLCAAARADTTVTTLAALNEALKTATGGEVITIDGTISVDQAIVIPPDAKCTIRGGRLVRAAGYNKNIIYFENNVYSNGYAVSSGAVVTLDGIYIDGNKSAVSIAGALIGTGAGEKITVTGCTLTNNGGTGIDTHTLTGDSHVTVRNSEISHNTSHGIGAYMIFDVIDSRIIDNDCGLYGYTWNYGSSFSVKNCVIRDNKKDGVYVRTAYSSTHWGNSSLTVSGGEISGNKGCGIYLTTTDAVLDGNIQLIGNKTGLCNTGWCNTAMANVTISGSTECGITNYGSLTLKGGTVLQDPVILDTASSVPNGKGTITVDAGYPNQETIAQVKCASNIKPGMKLIRIVSPVYAGISQFVCLNEGYEFVMGDDGWASFEEHIPVPVTGITLSQSEAALVRTSAVNQPTLQLTAAVEPANADEQGVEWFSSNPAVAAVDENGLVTGLVKGEAVITCRSKDAGGFEASCAVTVSEKQVEKISLSKSKATLKKGKTLQLKVKKLKPADAFNKKVKWTSSNKKVASVDKNGKVKAKRAGTCVITCAALDGSGVKATCKITVKDSKKAVRLLAVKVFVLKASVLNDE